MNLFWMVSLTVSLVVFLLALGYTKWTEKSVSVGTFIFCFVAFIPIGNLMILAAILWDIVCKALSGDFSKFFSKKLF